MCRDILQDHGLALRFLALRIACDLRFWLFTSWPLPSLGHLSPSPDIVIFGFTNLRIERDRRVPAVDSCFQGREIAAKSDGQTDFMLVVVGTG